MAAAETRVIPARWRFTPCLTVPVSQGRRQALLSRGGRGGEGPEHGPRDGLARVFRSCPLLGGWALQDWMGDTP